MAATPVPSQLPQQSASLLARYPLCGGQPVNDQVKRRLAHGCPEQMRSSARCNSYPCGAAITARSSLVYVMRRSGLIRPCKLT